MGKLEDKRVIVMCSGNPKSKATKLGTEISFGYTDGKKDSQEFKKVLSLQLSEIVNLICNTSLNYATEPVRVSYTRF